MQFSNISKTLLTGLVMMTSSLMAMAADYPAPKESVWVARDFRFQSGEVLPELRVSYTR